MNTFVKSVVAGALLWVSTAVGFAEPAVVAIEGKVREPYELTLQFARERWPDEVQLTTYRTEEREETGYAVELLRCLDVDVASEEKNALVRFVCLAQGRDEYLVALSMGELLPELGNRRALLIWSEDGEKVRLLLPEDGEPARSVFALTSIRVLELRGPHTARTPPSSP